MRVARRAGPSAEWGEPADVSPPVETLPVSPLPVEAVATNSW